MTPNQLDEIILSLVRPQWRKVAMIVAKALNECEIREIPANADEIAGRVETLVSENRLESQGNLSNWRHSEVRLPA